ncbi:MAG: hypothetical protein HUJ80_00075, partial [Firmicutes bacterium]|nr:hypothetical protein [Bacillota bacterium]
MKKRGLMKTRNKLRGLFFTGLLLVLFSGLAFAQEPAGYIVKLKEPLEMMLFSADEVIEEVPYLENIYVIDDLSMIEGLY